MTTKSHSHQIELVSNDTKTRVVKNDEKIYNNKQKTSSRSLRKKEKLKVKKEKEDNKN